MTETDVNDNDLYKAVALFYDGERAPAVAAKGVGQAAEDIIAIAREYDVPLCDNPALLDLLITLELGEAIPESLYIAVAHIIAFAYQLQGKTPPDTATQATKST